MLKGDISKIYVHEESDLHYQFGDNAEEEIVRLNVKCEANSIVIREASPDSSNRLKTVVSSGHVF